MNIASFVFVKKPSSMILGKPRNMRSNLGVLLEKGRYFSNGLHFLGHENPTANFAGRSKSSNKHFLLVPSHKNDMYFCKLALKVAKIGTLGAWWPGFQSQKLQMWLLCAKF
jgi:hypothetical protein